ncbi:HalOD1 output domain-containing protein [Halovivax limisalsi]|uniref:HalOD1 output domain-containing protein n=1 Tax=Halovivax limisalsi TaxID=1453760 RepID=UPI001FFC7D9C|nr:HalOD1 output domain-containing protein [Halovivax limisalsi]
MDQQTGLTATTPTTDYDAPVSERVIEEVAAATDADPLEMTPLYDVLDPDALDALFSTGTGQTNGELRFTMAGCEVVVHGDGEVVVTPTGRSARA